MTVPTGSAPPYGRGVAGHELGAALVRSRDVVRMEPETHQGYALRVLDPAIVWAQLGQVLDRPDVVAMADLILTDQLATRDDLERIARDWQGRRGAAALHWALPQIRSGPLSRPESLHRQLIMRAGIPEPELNVMVYDERGGALALADEVWPDYRVLVEYEGDHHRERGRFRADITRFERYADAGWGAARTHAHDVFGDPNPAIGRLWRRLVANGWRSRQRAPRPVFAMRA